MFGFPLAWYGRPPSYESMSFEFKMDHARLWLFYCSSPWNSLYPNPLWHTQLWPNCPHQCGHHCGHRCSKHGALIITVARWMQGTAAGSSTRTRQWDSWERLWGNPWFLWLMNGNHTVRYYQPVGLFFHASHKLAIIGEDFLPDFWTILVFFLVKR